VKITCLFNPAAFLELEAQNKKWNIIGEHRVNAGFALLVKSKLPEMAGRKTTGLSFIKLTKYGGRVAGLRQCLLMAGSPRLVKFGRY